MCCTGSRIKRGKVPLELKATLRAPLLPGDPPAGQGAGREARFQNPWPGRGDQGLSGRLGLCLCVPCGPGAALRISGAERGQHKGAAVFPGSGATPSCSKGSGTPIFWRANAESANTAGCAGAAGPGPMRPMATKWPKSRFACISPEIRRPTPSTAGHISLY